MSSSNRTFGAHTQSLLNAADYIRAKYQVPDEETLMPYIEREYNCRFVQAANSSPMLPIWELEFNSEEDLTAFLLQWAGFND